MSDAQPGVPAGDGAVLVDASGEVVEVPIENREQGERPGPESATALAERVLRAILADAPGLAIDTVFPVAAFELLKDMPDPAVYHRRLVRWFEEDVHAEHERLGDRATLELERFQLGRCSWQARNTEGNHIPYWSCRHNWIWARAAGREWKIELRVLINWGPTWFVTHLGPSRR